MNEREAYLIAFARARIAYESYGDCPGIIIAEVIERIGDNRSLADKVTNQVTSGQKLPDGMTKENMLDAVKFLEGFRRIK